VLERILEVNGWFGPVDPINAILLCECGGPDCSARLEVPADVFDVVRSEEHRFVVAPGHEQPEAEEVVAGAPSYLVIAMRPAAV
jgi:hypothetical protein